MNPQHTCHGWCVKMKAQCGDDPCAPTFQRSRPVCCVCKTEYVSKANRCRCEASSAFSSPANPPHPHRPLPTCGFFAPRLMNTGPMRCAQQQLHHWWSSLQLHESAAILQQVIEPGSAVVPASLLLWLGQVNITTADLKNPRRAFAALDAIEIVSDAHRDMALAGM